MAPKHHPIPLSGGDRKALTKELAKSSGIETMLAREAADLRARGEAMIRKADDLACQAWNERMWRDGSPIDPSPAIHEAVNGGFPYLEVRCSRCKTPSTVDLAALCRPATTCVHDLAGRLVCLKCTRAGKRPSTTLLQLVPSKRTADQ